MDEAMKIVAMNVFEYNSTLAARAALGHGISRDEIALSLESLAYAIRTQDVAESMYPIDDGGTFEQTFV